MNLKEKIQDIEKELDIYSINKQRKRYLNSYLGELLGYLSRHPNATKVPSSLELFCDLNPEAKECRVFDL